MSQPSTSINTKLVDSLAQIILSLTDEERQLLEKKIQASRSSLTWAELSRRVENLGSDPAEPTLEELSNLVKETRQERRAATSWELL